MSEIKNKKAAAVFSPIEDLIPWVKNPRFNDSAVEKVAESIQKFGFSSPIIARLEDKRVISGHTRLKAALMLGLKEVPVRYLEISDADADALALAENRLGEIASWDDGLLSEILSDLKESNYDVDVIGFSEQELNQLLGEWEDPFYEDNLINEDNTVEDIDEDHIIEDNGRTAIYVSVPVTMAQDATELIGQILLENSIPHQFKVK